MLRVRFISNEEEKDVMGSKVLRVKVIEPKKIRLNESCGYIDKDNGYVKYGVIKEILDDEVKI